MQSDTVADLLTRIRNGVQARHLYVDVMNSKKNIELLKALIKKNLIKSYKVFEKFYQIRVYLKYDEESKPIVTHFTRESKPGKRKYVKACEIPVIRRGLGVALVSTSQGIKDGYSARKMNLGGELICTIW
jgi:small subunit ribosomal protein S8